MKTESINLAKSFAAAMMMIMGLTFASCDNSDEPGDKLTKEAMYGNYTGIMTTQAATLEEGESAGVEITASVDNDIVTFTNFPIRDIVMTIVGDEEATNAIIEAVGDVNYEIGYKPAVVAASQSINITLDPKPLVLEVALEADAEPLTVTVDVKAGNDAVYTASDSKMKFSITVDKVWLGSGDDKTELPGFEPLSLTFDMARSKK